MRGLLRVPFIILNTMIVAKITIPNGHFALEIILLIFYNIPILKYVFERFTIYMYINWPLKVSLLHILFSQRQK